MINRYIHIVLYIFLVTLFSCQKPLTSEAELLQWIKNKDNGFTKEKNVGDFILTMTHLPSEYLAKKEFPEKNWKELEDSLKTKYKHLYCFILGIKPAKELDFNIMHWNVKNEVDYKIRNNNLNFSMHENLKLTYGDKDIYAIYAILENTYKVENGKRWNVYFPIEDIASIPEEITVKFEDIYFNTGINSFKFDIEQLNNFPEIQY